MDPFAPLDRAPVGGETTAISVVLIGDNRVACEGIAALLNQLPNILAVTRAPDTVVLPAAANPDVVLLGLGLDCGSSLRLVAKVRQELPDAKVLVMDLLPTRANIVEFVKLGVWGFILQDATLADLVKTIRSVAQGTRVLPPPVTATLFSQIAANTTRPNRPETPGTVRLTPREREVALVIAEGLSNKEIATRLGITSDTVKSHVRNIMEKLMLHTRLQIAAYANRESTR